MVTSPVTAFEVTISRSRRRMILPLRVLGSASVNRISSGRAKAPISFADPLAQFLAELVVVPIALLQRDEAQTAWPVISCGLPTTAASATAGMMHQRRFDFHGAEPVAADVHHVVDAAQHPVVAIVIAARGIAGEIRSGHARPILLLEALRIAPDVAHHAGPGMADDQDILRDCSPSSFALGIHDVDDDAGQRQRAASRASAASRRAAARS